MRSVLALTIACAGGLPALADVFVRPEACELIATVQTDTCEVNNHYNCPSANGPIAREEAFDIDGLASVSIFDPSTGVSTLDFVWNDGSMRMQSTGDSDLDVVRNGSGSMSAVGEVRLFGLWRPFSGTETSVHSGETLELAGKTFHRIESGITLQLPYPIPAFKGRDVRAYNEELNLTVGVETSLEEDALAASNSKLMQLSLRGQPGFGDEQPRHGCMTLGAVSVMPHRGRPA
jgi:hypothetical protein